MSVCVYKHRHGSYQRYHDCYMINTVTFYCYTNIYIYVCYFSICVIVLLDMNTVLPHLSAYFNDRGLVMVLNYLSPLVC